MKFAIFGNTYQAKKSSHAVTLFKLLKKQGAEIGMCREFYQFLVSENMDIEADQLFDGDDFTADMVISIGGDGTFLKAARRVGRKGIPILGINTGRLGFLADISPEEMEEKEDLENHSDGFSILVVEDNEELKAFLKNILSENYTVITASNGEEGLQHAVDDLPDLIISDVMMPVMDGLEMIRQIKENNNICHIPIIVLSAKASLDDRIAGLEQGIDDYITKPFSATYLKTRIASLLRQRKALQEIYMNRLMEGKTASSPDLLTPSQPQITPYDEQFMEKVMAYMEEQMDNAELTIDQFAEQLMLSRTIFYRKLKSIVGLTPVDFIREIRIKRAVQLIDSDEYNFSQVAYMTGFNDPKYFSKCFKKVIGITPSEYKERKK